MGREQLTIGCEVELVQHIIRYRLSEVSAIYLQSKEHGALYARSTSE